jgi:hypothetical protein
MLLNGQFYWWHVVDGVALCVPDSPEVSALIDAGATGFYGNIEGAIIHGGVQATAFKRTIEPTFDAMAFLQRGEWLATGTIMHTKITAEPREA